MELFQINLIKAIQELKKLFPNEKLLCLETGTLRNLEHKHNSTLHISNTLRDTDEFTSIDINPEYIEISKEVCKHNKNTKWITSDSVSYLKTVEGKFHFVFLDTMNCKNFIFEEFKLIMPHMLENSILIIDDAGVNVDGTINMNTTRVIGHNVSAFLFSIGITDCIRTSPIGTQIWINLDKYNLEIILKGLENV